MNPPPRYFVRVGRDERGPYDLAQLRELAGVEVITLATEAAAARDGPWVRMETLPERATIFPPRAVLVFKPTEFAVENAGNAPPVDVREIIGQAHVPGRILRPSHPPELAAVHAAKAAAAPDEVEAMVREVREREAQFAPPPPPPPKWRPSRRLKLVVVLALIGNGVLVAIPIHYDALGDDWSMMVIRGWFVLYNGALTGLYFIFKKV